MREPKLAKLKGGITSGASLFFNNWVKDVRAVILERSMSNAESLQLVKDYTEGKARQQVEFYIVSTPDPTFKGLIDNLRTSFQSGEDEATVKGEFYSHKQFSKESVDDFADVVPAKCRKTEEESTIAAQLSMCIKDNQELHKRLDAFDPSKIVEVVTQAVAGGYQKSFQKPNTYQKSTNPFVPSQQKPQASQNANPFGKPYLGPPRESQVTPSADGSLNPVLSCKYCKDMGHDVSNCTKVKRKEALKAAAASQQPNVAKKGN